MLLFSSKLAKHSLEFKKLSENMEHLKVAATWTESEWGYIRNVGIEKRMELMKDINDHIYIGTFNNQPVAMFALFPHEFHPDLKDKSARLPEIKELMYVCVDDNYRGLGFGRQIIESAKEIARNEGAKLLLLDTLKPNLNKLYEKFGAKVIAEGRCFSEPTDMMRITL
jgi:diamine N-acetyltransferase